MNHNVIVIHGNQENLLRKTIDYKFYINPNSNNTHEDKVAACLCKRKNQLNLVQYLICLVY